MNDLEDLKDAMHATPDFEPRPLDLDAVMAQGGRLRRRRQLAVGATSGVAVLALLVGGAQVARLGGDGGGAPASAPIAAAAPSAASSGEPTPASSGEPTPGASGPTGAPATTLPATVDATPAGDVLGEVIKTGLQTPEGEQVLWFQPVEDEAIPDTTFGVMLGRRTADGKLHGDVVINETEGSDRSPGFHSPEAPMEVNGIVTPAFGYYAGAGAVKITVVADGRRVQARTAVWSEDPSIVVFWFDPAEVKPDAELTKLTAYDKEGRILPGAGTGFAVG